MDAWSFTGDAERYADAAESWLCQSPAANTLLITTLTRLRQGLNREAALLGWWTGDGRTAGAFHHWPPFPLALADMPVPAVADLARALADSQRRPDAVVGRRDLAEAFAATWRDATGAAETGRMRERLYRLGDLVAPESFPEGAPRTAEMPDLPLVADWYRAFLRESRVDSGDDPRPANRMVGQRLSGRELVLWEVGGEPVALGGVTTPVAAMARVAPVYTPPDRRRRGYGAAVTHAVTRRALSEGARDVVLFTDLANPTSNQIYQALGYRGVADYAEIRF